MAKKKSKKTIQKAEKTSFFRLLGRLLIIIIKLPWTIAKGIHTLQQKFDQSKQVKEVKTKREAMTAQYEPFTVTETKQGNFQAFEKHIFASDSTIGIIVGARGSGKTGFGIKLLENLYAKHKKKCFAIGFIEQEMPSWITVAEDPQQLENNGFVLIDEGGILFSSRKSMTSANKMLSDLLLIARHKNLSILFIAQNSSNLDVNIIRQADYLVVKKPSLLQKDFERKFIQDIYNKVGDEFKKYGDKKGVTYIYADKFTGFVENPLPSFWSVKISKSFAQVQQDT